MAANPLVESELAARPVVWTIAGSDSGGGAGIQADLLTLHDLGCHGCSVITAITAQNSVAVTAVEPVSPAMLAAQLEALKADLYPAAVKIGLIANQAQLEFLAQWLGDNLPGVPVILDPVMVASCGDELQHAASRAQGAATVSTLDFSGLDFSAFAGRATLITPNVTEVARLVSGIAVPYAGESIGEEAESDCTRWRLAVRAVARHFGVSLLAKGGDARWQTQHASDLLLLSDIGNISTLYRGGEFYLESPRVDTANNHGSGCTLSSAIAAFMAKGMVLPDAVMMAKAYVYEGLKASFQPGSGPGPLARTGTPASLSSLPKVRWVKEPSAKLTKSADDMPAGPFPALPRDLGVYPVVSDVALLQTLLEAGAKTIQLRIKTDTPDSPDDAALEAAIVRAIALGKQYQARLFINDHWQLAIKHGAFGVHLGQEDADSAALERIVAAGLALGLSSHGVFEARLALELKPSYLALGHIFPTTTKTMPSPPQGLSMLTTLSRLFSKSLPTVAIGGIDGTNLTDVAATGVDNIAVVRAVTQASEPAAAYRALAAAWEARHAR
ncbi:thiamine phosphate synthase [Shewanella sp. JM162201]|uniref:Thiamine-phosphate synthase n=1 Tax=Shewanella jiangmenensis TaxID=2837387 RepID=A0ABS5V6A4_9GAMM|nr:thiamine phosphate synthase [Shewanella jiangmenensis]MBT1445979.1 thiamine phosphate synthase [Shewanella jiangmenensis]